MINSVVQSLMLFVPCIVTMITDIHKLFAFVGVCVCVCACDYISELTSCEGCHLLGSDYREYHLLGCDTTYTGKKIYQFL
jgi:hypothetical protein